MKKAEIIKQLIKEKGYNMKSFSEKCGIPYTTLYTILNKSGISGASFDVVTNICDNLGITSTQLKEMAGESVPNVVLSEFDSLNVLMARNGKKLTVEEKQELIKTLLSDD